jgi:hypothetical protein
MANRQDSGSNAAHQNQRPDPHNEDAIPEMTDEPRGHTTSDDEFQDVDEIEDDVEDENEEGSF